MAKEGSETSVWRQRGFPGVLGFSGDSQSVYSTHLEDRFKTPICSLPCPPGTITTSYDSLIPSGGSGVFCLVILELTARRTPRNLRFPRTPSWRRAACGPAWGFSLGACAAGCAVSCAAGCAAGSAVQLVASFGRSSRSKSHWKSLAEIYELVSKRSIYYRSISSARSFMLSLIFCT